MSSKRLLSAPPPVFRARDALRLVSILLMGLFLLWAITKAQNPRTWNWLFAGAEPADVREGEAPAENARASDNLRRAPLPDADVLAGAWDRQRFLVDDPKDLAEIGNWRDANARYHLLQIAATANAEDLAADAREDIRYSALMQNPEKHRGEIVHIEGNLRRVSHFEMKRSVPGVERCYQGWVTVDGVDQTYCILFADLPAGFPPEKEWPRQIIPVRFDGYFLKLLKADDSRQKDKHVFVPVLIGRAVSVVEPPASNIVSIAAVVLAVFVGTVLISGVALWLYRRGDRRLSAKMAELRQARVGLDSEAAASGNGEAPSPILVNQEEKPSSEGAGS